MPNIFAMIKDYVIDSEEDVPAQYREEIEKRLSDNWSEIETDEPDVNAGKKGDSITLESDISNILNDSEELYFGHGTSGEEVIDSIFEIGLKTINPEVARFYGNTLRGLDSTTVTFGEGTDSLFTEEKDTLNNWPHKNSNNVIIISIPKKYALRVCETGSNVDLYEAFYIGNKEEGFRIRPEFIRGVYNVDSQSFTPNDNFYQNLQPERQSELLEDVKKKYIKLYAQHSKKSPDSVIWPLPLNESELEELAIEWYKVQVEKFRRDKTFEPEMLDTDLHEITGETLMSDFNDATHSIRVNTQQELEENRENSEEGWILDDWE